MNRVLTALASGILFTVGLNLSGMTLPRKIIGFLDFTGLYTGKWDPSLLVVMFTALGVHAVLFRLIVRRPKPVLAPKFLVPPPGKVDRSLVIGSLIWGAGWGLTGLCPGPILAAVGALQTPALVFFGTMLLGMAVHAFVHGAPKAEAAEPATK